MKNEIVFWLDSPPVCCKGIFDAVSELNDGKTYYVCVGETGKDRSNILSDSKNTGKAEYVMLAEQENSKECAFSFIKEHIDAIHIFNGYLSRSSSFIKHILKRNKNAKCIVWAERPNFSKKRGLKRYIYEMLNGIKHTFYALYFRKKICALLPLGEKGVVSYQKYGWPKEKLFSFLYVPVMNESIPLKSGEVSDKIKFVYLGRFSSGWKGTDVLLRATEQLKNQNYSLEFVGGYGDYKNQTLEFINKNSRLSFGGTWPIEEACERLSDFDVCIVPSRYEGWNVTVNEALMAGIGCIVTDETVSDELVTASGAGLVVKADDSAAIAAAMDTVMENPSMIKMWGNAAYVFRGKMNSRVCADYFLKIIKFLFDNKGEDRPVPPWIT